MRYMIFCTDDEIYLVKGRILMKTFFFFQPSKIIIYFFTIFIYFQAVANLSKPTISGISSGAFMSVQMATIFSNQFSGVGTVAGGFFYCSQNHLQEKIREGELSLIGSKNLFLFNTTNIISAKTSKWFEPSPSNPIYQSVAICMHNPKSAQRPDLNKFQSENKINPLENFKNLNAYIYQGENDTVVHKEMVEQLVSFYTENQLSKEKIYISLGTGGHNFPTDKENLNNCLAEKIPYLSSCNKDVASEILQHTTLKTYDKSEPTIDHIYVLDQNLDLKNSGLNEDHWVQPSKSLAPYAYLYAPDICLSTPSFCHLHVALHGCEMSDSFNKDFDEAYAKQISQYQNLTMRSKSTMLFNILNLPYIEQKVNKYGTLKFVLNAGYIDYAEKNNLMILFPQTWITQDNYPYNPKGCWDWFGWTGSDYATVNGGESSWLSKYITEVSIDPKRFIMTAKPHFQDIK